MSVVQGWQKVIACISPKKMSIASYLQEGNLESLDGNVLTMSFASEFKFHKEMLESADNKKLVEDAIKEILALDLRMAFRLGEYGRPAAAAGGKGPGNGVGYLDDGASADDAMASRGEGGRNDDDPIVSSALQMFGGQIAQTSKKGKSA